MRTQRRNAIGQLCAVWLVALASDASAQQAPSADRQAVEQIRRDLEPIRRSRLVGAADSLAVEMPSGELIPVAAKDHCAPPVARAGVIQIDCVGLDDGGAVYYFDEATRAMIEPCDPGRADPRRCPPAQWPIEVPGCDGSVPPSTGGAWRFHSLPGADGFYAINTGWTMTLAGDSMLLDFQGVAQVVRSYAVVAAGDRRYTLKIEDARAATTALGVELVQCGMIVEGSGVCDAFCRNVAGEFGIQDLPQYLEPLFPARAYFRSVPVGE